MQTRTYGDLFSLITSLIGHGGELPASGNEDEIIRNFINRRFQQIFDESPVWERYLVTSEQRDIYAYNISGITAGQHTQMNQNYKLLGLNSGAHGKAGTNVYQGGSTNTTYIYKNTSNAWIIVTGISGNHTVNTDNEIVLSAAGTAKFTEADAVKKDLIEDVVTWTENGSANGPPVILPKNLIPYAQTGKTTIGGFNRIHRKQAFRNQSSIEYDFFVDVDGGNILNVVNTTDNSAFVTYKKEFTPFTVTSDYYNSTVEVPAEFFNFIAHSVYADFLRVQNRQQEAIAEEGVAQTYLALELEKIDIRANNNTVNKRFSTYVNRQSR
jgi:hypothetical protein